MAITRDVAYTTTDGVTGTTWAGAEYVPELYAKKVLQKFYAQTVFMDVCNTDYEGEFKNKGDKINIRKAPDIVVGDYTVGGTIDYQVPAADSTEMVIDQAKYMAFRCDDVDKVQSDIDLVNMYADDAGNQLSVVVDQDGLQVMALGVAAVNQGATAGAISDIDMGTNGVGTQIDITSTNAADYIVYLNQVLDESNIPSEDRFVIVPAWYASRLKTGDLKRADVTGDGTGVIRSGLIGTVDRTKVYVNNNIYQQTAGQFSVVAGKKSGCSFAMQLSKTDTLPIQDSFGEFWRQLYVYGRKVVQDDHLAKLICSPA